MARDPKTLTPILVAEDSDEDFDVLAMTCRQFAVTNELLRVAEGRLVLQLLEQRWRAKLELPGLIILDLNLIGVDGREVLLRLKRHPRFAAIPVVVFSTSASPRDISTSYANGAAAYAVKPVNLERLEQFVIALKSFWLDHAVLPSDPPAVTGANP